MGVVGVIPMGHLVSHHWQMSEERNVPAAVDRDRFDLGSWEAVDQVALGVGHL